MLFILENLNLRKGRKIGGEWKVVESGEWRVESGEWREESGKWKVESGKFKHT